MRVPSDIGKVNIGKVKGRVAYEPQDTHRPNIPPPTPEGPPLNAWLCHVDESKQRRNCCPWLDKKFEKIKMYCK